MLVRDSEGRLIIISRKDCKTEKVYNEKLYKIRLNYTNKFKSVYVNPKPSANTLNNYAVKDITDD